MDWNPLHSSLVTGAGTPWGTTDNRQSWEAFLNVNLDPRFSDAFKNVELPVAEIVAVAAATYFTAGAATGPTLAALGLTGAAATAATGVIAGGIATGFTMANGFLENQLGLGQGQEFAGQGWLAQNDKTLSIIGGTVAGTYGAAQTAANAPNTTGDPGVPPSPMDAGKQAVGQVLGLAKSTTASHPSAPKTGYSAITGGAVDPGYGPVNQYGPWNQDSPQAAVSPKALMAGGLAFGIVLLATKKKSRL